MNSLFKGIFDTSFATVISVGDFLLCIGVALLLGAIIAASFLWKNNHTKSFVVTLAMLPAAVCVVIMMVNGNIGAGVAVAGAFSLVRFRSAPGSAKEIVAIFIAMGSGLICGMGYLGYAALFTVIMSLFFMLYNTITSGGKNPVSLNKTIKITIPEDLDYTGVFDEIFTKYANTWELIQVKSVNMGSMFRLVYDVRLKSCQQEKAMIDEIRIRNGNLEVMVSRRENSIAEL